VLYAPFACTCCFIIYFCLSTVTVLLIHTVIKFEITMYFRYTSRRVAFGFASVHSSMSCHAVPCGVRIWARRLGDWRAGTVRSTRLAHLPSAQPQGNSRQGTRDKRHGPGAASVNPQCLQCGLSAASQVVVWLLVEVVDDERVARELAAEARGLVRLVREGHRARVPVGASKEGHGGGEEERAHDERVEEDGDDEGEGDLVDRRVGGEEKAGEGDGHDEAGGGDDVARAHEADRDRWPVGAAGEACLVDAGE
jgi:hypothetical protein